MEEVFFEHTITREVTTKVTGATYSNYRCSCGVFSAGNPIEHEARAHATAHLLKVLAHLVDEKPTCCVRGWCDGVEAG